MKRPAPPRCTQRRYTSGLNRFWSRSALLRWRRPRRCFDVASQRLLLMVAARVPSPSEKKRLRRAQCFVVSQRTFDFRTTVFTYRWIQIKAKRMHIQTIIWRSVSDNKVPGFQGSGPCLWGGWSWRTSSPLAQPWRSGMTLWAPLLLEPRILQVKGLPRLMSSFINIMIQYTYGQRDHEVPGTLFVTLVEVLTCISRSRFDILSSTVESLASIPPIVWNKQHVIFIPSRQQSCWKVMFSQVSVTIRVEVGCR